jgi:hypothetical protein
MSEERTDRLELITRLKGHAGVPAALEELREQRRRYEANLGRELVRGNRLVDQREIDFKRGFWYGLEWAYSRFLDNAEAGLEKAIEEALQAKERED